MITKLSMKNHIVVNALYKLLIILTLSEYTVHGHDIKKSNGITHQSDHALDAGASSSMYHRVVKRAEPANEDLYVENHNQYRRLEGGSNIQHMTWDNQLYVLAGAWADRCVFEHGQPTGLPMPYETLGQNLCITTDMSSSLDKVFEDCMAAFMAEKRDFTFSTRQCVEGAQCGHYTQIVWAESNTVGCAISTCAAGTIYQNSQSRYLVCNYGPPGNAVSSNGVLQPLYDVGPACTTCSSGEFWCDRGLCRPRDSCDADVACESLTCEARCLNCAVTNSNTCTCTCADGWTGPDCSTTCEDKNDLCGANPGWPAVWCGDSRYTFVTEACLVMCNLCTPSDGTPPATCPTTPTPVPTTPTPVPTTPTPVPTTPTPVPTTPTPVPTTPTPVPTTPTPVPTTPTPVPTPSPTSANCIGFCQNGGTVSAVDGQCRCSCPQGYAGSRCEVVRKVDLRVRLHTTLQTWNVVYGIWLRPLLVNAVNIWCSSNIPSCCDNTFLQSVPVTREYTNVNYVHVDSRYPIQYNTAVGVVTEAMIYVSGAPDNALCALASSSGKRRKRSVLHTEYRLSFQSMAEILDLISANLTETLKTCCNITSVELNLVYEKTEVPSIQTTGGLTDRGTTSSATDLVIDDVTDRTDMQDSGLFGLNLWQLTVLGILIASLFLISVSLSICFCCLFKSKEKSPLPNKTGFDNIAYS